MVVGIHEAARHAALRIVLKVVLQPVGVHACMRVREIIERVRSECEVKKVKKVKKKKVMIPLENEGRLRLGRRAAAAAVQRGAFPLLLACRWHCCLDNRLERLLPFPSGRVQRAVGVDVVGRRTLMLLLSGVGLRRVRAVRRRCVAKRRVLGRLRRLLLLHGVAVVRRQRMGRGVRSTVFVASAHEVLLLTERGHHGSRISRRGGVNADCAGRR